MCLIDYLQAATTASEVFIVSVEPSVVVQQAVPARSLLVSVKDDFVSARIVHADEVIREALGWMEVEAKDDASSVKHDDLVFFVLPRHVTLQNSKQL